MNWQAVFTAVQYRQASEPTLSNLSTGAPLLEPAVSRAAAQAAATIQRLPDSGQNLLGTYAHEAGWPPLMELFRQRLSRAWHRPVSEAEVAVIPGVTQTLHYIHEALRDRAPDWPGLTRGPYRLSFPAGGLEWFGLHDHRNPLPPATGPYLTQPAGAASFRMVLPDPLLLDWDGVGAVGLSHPHCPTGCVWSAEELGSLADAAARNGAVVLLDEAEAHPSAPLSQIQPALVDHPHIMHLFSFSKIGLAGPRIGLAVGSPVFIAALRALIHDAMIQVSALDQFVATAALQVLAEAEPTSWFGKRYAERWLTLATILRDAGALDESRQLALWEGGPYAWYSWKAGATSQEIFSRLLDAGVAVCPSSALQFGREAPINGIRIGLGGQLEPAEFERALARLAPALAAATEQPSEAASMKARRRAIVQHILQDKLQPAGAHMPLPIGSPKILTWAHDANRRAVALSVSTP